MAEPPQESDNEDGEEEYDENEEEGEGEEENLEEEEAQIEEEKFISVFERLDAPRDLPEPIELTIEHVKQIQSELGIIILCWPDIKNPYFEGRVNFPEEYTKNSEKEKFLLLYTENFRRQFVAKFPQRKPLFLAAPNETGLMKMVCTTLRPTKLPHKEIDSAVKCSGFVGDQLLFEPLPAPTLLFFRGIAVAFFATFQMVAFSSDIGSFNRKASAISHQTALSAYFPLISFSSFLCLLFLVIIL